MLVLGQAAGAASPAVGAEVAGAGAPRAAGEGGAEQGAVVIGAPEDCAPAVAADPEAAREAAAHWYRLGGGAPARLCEAAALEALGAPGLAAGLLTRLAENPLRALSGAVRAGIFVDAARLWLDAGQPALAQAALGSAARLAPPGAEALVLAARAAGALEDWAAALAALDDLVEAHPEHAEGRALRAAALRHRGDPAAALAEARAALAHAPDRPEARFEEAAALAELGEIKAAVAGFLDLATEHPEHPLAEPARANVRRLSGLSGAAASP